MIKDHIGAKPAPPTLRVVQAFVNTSELDSPREDLAAPADLEAWLREHQLLAGDATLSEADLRQATALREALRVLLLTNNGEVADPDAIATLNRSARSAQMAVIFEPGGTVKLEPRTEGVDGALGRLLTIVFDAMANGSWKRLKACKEKDCQWAFFDHSKNRSGAWCAMSVCGNRTKARAYRGRQMRKL